MKVVLDTVVFVRGLIGPHSWWGRLIFDYAGHYELVVSPLIVAEYLEVVHRPNLTRKLHTVAARDVRTILDQVANATVVYPKETPAVCRDPGDDKFLAAAKAGEAQFIVTEDTDLLDMETYEEIAIVTARAFLRILEETGSHRQG